jgi:predicted NAD/FAD-binding protein
MRIAVIGAGVSGLVSAYLLRRSHEVVLFEADDRIGGHVHTVDVAAADGTWPVDTGFIVFNRGNYPGFCRLLERLGVASQPSDMSFAVRDDRDGTEYRGSGLDTLFAQRRNLLRPRFWGMARDILRFFRQAGGLLAADPELTLGQWLDARRFGRAFQEQHILPMGAALWSMPLDDVRGFPARHFAAFLANHQMLQVKGRPVWRTVQGGSRTYVDALLQGWRQEVRTGTPIARVQRRADRVDVTPAGGQTERFDHVVLACHSDQALALLADPSDRERAVLGAIGYRDNDVVLHTDAAAVLPRVRKAWASWNYRLEPGARTHAAVTYHMNRLQDLPARDPFCVSLNETARLDAERVHGRWTYAHPQFTTAAVAAQAEHQALNAEERTSYCGAYWGWGFHEDGVQSALKVAARFGEAL